MDQGVTETLPPTTKRASAARPRRRSMSVLGSPITRLILASNLIGLAILLSGALILNELRAGVVRAQAASLLTQSEAVASLLAEGATIGEPEPALLPPATRDLLRTLSLPPSVRGRVFDREGRLVADSFSLSDRVDQSALPAAARPGLWARAMAGLSDLLADVTDSLRPDGTSNALRLQSFEEEFAIARGGETSVGQRFSESGERVISISLPIRRVSAVVGVLTLEGSDLAQIVKAERMALIPFLLVAVLVALFTSVLLTVVIAQPLRRLALAADRVRAGSARQLDLPGLHKRRDEIGDLARSLESMTSTLFERIVANERFAADVAHELKNPLTSIRSAVETAERVQHDPEARERLRQVIAQDVRRLDRLITDISNASRMEAQIAREGDARIDLPRLLSDIASSYEGQQGAPVVVLGAGERLAQQPVRGLQGPMGQVFRNLIDNARSFSPPEGSVRVSLHPSGERPFDNADGIEVRVEDDGPGIPPDKLEKIFDRFYSDRPAGSAFGNNSGLGLSIARQIVEAHGGTLQAENRAGPDGTRVGARFVVRLPLAGA